MAYNLKLEDVQFLFLLIFQKGQVEIRQMNSFIS